MTPPTNAEVRGSVETNTPIHAKVFKSDHDEYSVVALFKNKEQATQARKMLLNPNDWWLTRRKEELSAVRKMIADLRLGKPNIPKGHSEYQRMQEDNQVYDEAVLNACMLLDEIIGRSDEV